MDTNISCVECGPQSPPDCQLRDCRIPVDTVVSITCTLVMGCTPHSHPLRLLRITPNTPYEIRPGDVRGVMPGFVSLNRPDDCSLVLTFIASAAANNVVLQCGVSTNETMEYSRATLLAVKGRYKELMPLSHT